MPPAAMAGIAVASGLMQYAGQRRAAKDQNKFLQQGAAQFSPEMLWSRLAQTNPQAFRALFMGNKGQEGTYQNNLFNIANNPGWMDPRLMNQPMQQSMRGAQDDLIAASGKLGRANMRGGMGNLAALSSQAADTQRRVGVRSQHNLFREQQRRTDLGYIGNLMNQLLSGATDQARGASGMLGQQQAVPNWMTGFGNAGQAGLYAYGGMQGMGGGGGGGAPGGGGGSIPGHPWQNPTTTPPPPFGFNTPGPRPSQTWGDPLNTPPPAFGGAPNMGNNAPWFNFNPSLG